jgi:hypothetical protein
MTSKYFSSAGWRLATPGSQLALDYNCGGRSSPGYDGCADEAGFLTSAPATSPNTCTNRFQFEYWGNSNQIPGGLLAIDEYSSVGVAEGWTGWIYVFMGTVRAYAEGGPNTFPTSGWKISNNYSSAGGFNQSLSFTFTPI